MPQNGHFEPKGVRISRFQHDIRHITNQCGQKRLDMARNTKKYPNKAETEQGKAIGGWD